MLWEKIENIVRPASAIHDHIKENLIPNLKITISQQNYKIGDFTSNYQKIISAINIAEHDGSDMVVFSEMALSGYYPWDLISRDSFWNKQDFYLNKILEASKNLSVHIVLGLARKNQSNVGKDYFNSLIVIHKGNIIFDYDKKLLPTYNIFDEARHFKEGFKSGLWEAFDTRIGFFICEDGWNDGFNEYNLNPIKELVDGGARLLIGINASPSNIYKLEHRESIFKSIAAKYGVGVVYVNQVGGQDDIVFDGGSFYYNGSATTIYQAPQFREINFTFSLQDLPHPAPWLYGKEEFIFEQLSLGLKDYLQKTGFKNIVVGSSGGIDSALTLAIATLALGRGCVTAIGMPSQYSSTGSVSDSVDLCKKLGIKFLVHPIADQFDVSKSTYLKNIGAPVVGLTSENLQARIRGQILMTYSNQTGALLLSTGNKSETSVGYCTLYGDSNGGLNILGDLYKMEVYALARFINQKYGSAALDHSGVLIPTNIIDKAPSAELAPGQKDEDNLPPYPLLDTILYWALEAQYLPLSAQRAIREIIDTLDQTTVVRVLKLIDLAEYKRRQSPPIIRIHQLAFGSGRKVPIAHGLSCS